MSLADQVRAVADRLAAESKIQYAALDRIQSASEKMGKNYDKLVEEVVESVEQDIKASEN